jgi:hypothetical protein
MLTCDPFDVEAVHQHTTRLLQDRGFYEEVVQVQYERLAGFDEEASRRRLTSALEQPRS